MELCLVVRGVVKIKQTWMIGSWAGRATNIMKINLQYADQLKNMDNLRKLRQEAHSDTHGF